MTLFHILCLCAAVQLARAQLALPLAFKPAFDPGLDVLLGGPRIKFGLGSAGLSLQANLKKREWGHSRPRRLDLGVHVGPLGLDVGVGGKSGLSVGLNISLGVPKHDQEWGVATLSAINVDADNEWTARLSAGTPPQVFEVILDSGSTDALLYDSSCRSCSLNNHTAFNSRRSSTFSAATSMLFGPETYADGTTLSGKTANDTFTLSSSVKVINHEFGLITSRSGGRAGTTYDGIVGLSRYGQGFFTGVPSLFGDACLQHAIKAPLMGVALVKAGLGNQGGGGEFNFGEVAQRYVAGDITYVNVSSSNAWGINITDFTANGQSLFTAGEPRRAAVDTGTTLVFTSDGAAAALHALVPGAAYNEDTESWTVPCATSSATGAPNLFFHINGVPFGIPAEDLAFQSGWKEGTCLSGVQGGSPDYTLLGDVFIKNHYIVFDFQSFDIESVKPRMGFANRTDIPPIL